MALRLFARISQHLRSSLWKGLLAACVEISFATSVQSKDAPLTAIELYNGPEGPAYVHITGILINGKSELRSCASTTKIDKSGYGKLPRVILGTGASLEYGNDGVLRLTRDATASCVVPSNLKFDKNSPVTPEELASRAVLQAKILSSGPDADQPAPPLKPGVKIIFVSAPDVELAEFLRADRAATIPLWQDYLGRYLNSPHTAQAKQALTSLLVQDGSNNLNAYRKSLTGSTRDNAALKNARLRVIQALAVLPSFVAAGKLDDETKTELDKIITEGKNEIQAYRQAVKAHAPGYAHLTATGKLANALFEIDPHYGPSLTFETDANNEAQGLDSKMRSAESLAGANRFDQAFAAISPYVGFADEVPRIGTIVKAAHEFHYGRGQELVAARDWDGAVQEFQKALDVKKTEQVAAALKSARAELEVMNDKHAADLALQQSQALASTGQVIQAYEVLSNLPARQRSSVAGELDHLGPAYIRASSDTAKDLQQAHDPIRGLRDELEIEQAYGYLAQANALTNDPKLKDRQQDLADKLSEYYLQQAKRYNFRIRFSSRHAGGPRVVTWTARRSLISCT